MKFVFIGCRDIHTLGGIESYMSNLARELVRRGHEPVIYCESNRKAIEWEDGIKLVHYKSIKNVYLCKIWISLKATFRTLIKEKNVAAIHYNSWPSGIWSFIPRMFGKKALLQGHGFGWERTKYSKKQQKIIKFVTTIVTKMNKYRIMCSDVQTEYYKKNHNLKCTTVPTAVNLPPESNSNEHQALEKYGLNSKEYFLYMGRLVQDKNPDYLIKAFNTCNNGNMKLVIAGANDADKGYVDYLHNIAKGNENVIFTGAIYGDEKDALLRNAYTFCLPSTIEGLSIVLLEAMSYKLPIIASDIAANKEVLEEKDAVWVRPESVDDLKNAIEFCINNPEIIEEVRMRNFNRIKKSYTWEKITDRYLEFWSSIGVS